MNQESNFLELTEENNDQTINQQGNNQLFTYLNSLNQQQQKSKDGLKLLPHQLTLFKKLIQEDKMSNENALFLIISSNCMNENEARNLLVDDEGMFLHLFSPPAAHGQGGANGEESKDGILRCTICDQIRDAHIQNNLLEARSLQIKINLLFNSQEGKLLMQKLQDPIITKQCSICYLEVDQNLMLMINSMLHEVCLECFKSYLEEEIKSGSVADIKCPHCSELISDQVIRQYIDSNTYKKYLIFKKNYLINHNPLCRWCPNSACAKVIWIENKNVESATCKHCNTVICCLCNRLNHPGISCQKVLEQEIQQLTDNRDVQVCQKCKALVQKISGCNHITCSVCQYQWCWLCGSTFSQFHFSLLNPFGCPFMQNGRFTNQNTNCFKLILIRLLTVIIILILTPIGLVFGGPILAVMLFSRWVDNRMVSITLRQKIVKMVFYIIVFLLGFAIDPFIAVAFALGLVPGIIFLIYQTYMEQARITQIAESNLRQREQQQHINELVGQNQIEIYDVHNSIQSNNGIQNSNQIAIVEFDQQN